MKWLVLVALTGCSPRTSSTSAHGPNGGAPNASPPPSTGVVRDVVEVRAAGFVESHAGCVRRKDGTVACWGGPNLLSSFGSGRTVPLPGPFVIPGLTDAISVVATYMGGSCAVKADHTAACWAGERAPTLLPVRNVVQLVVGPEFYCAVITDRTVQCAGKNGSGELGTGPRDYKEHKWTTVPGVTRVVQLSADNQRGVCALHDDGTVTCWGQHPFRRPSKTAAEFEATSAPQKVPGLTGVKRIAIANLACVATATEVSCGRRDAVPAPMERLAVPAADLVDLAVGGDDACFVLRDGSVHCWGPGPSAYVITGEEAGRREQQGYLQVRQIDGISDAVQVSISSFHGCVATRTGNARCWGNNEYGQLGDGTLASPTGPTWVTWFSPALLPGPGEGMFGCIPTPDIQRACANLGKACQLDAPPGYWNYGGGGVRCDDECMQRLQDELQRRRVPRCMCTCSPEYQKAHQRMLDEPPKP